MKHRTLDEIKELGKKQRLFILTIGIPAAGKTTYVKKHLSEFPIIDVDDYYAKLKSDSEPENRRVQYAIEFMDLDLKEAFSRTQTFVNVSTSKNIKSLLNKLKMAHRGSFLPTLIVFDVSIETAIERNRNRVAEGKKGLNTENEWRIKFMHEKISENITNPEVLNLVEYITVVKNDI